jgi:hypothetical protein
MLRCINSVPLSMLIGILLLVGCGCNRPPLRTGTDSDFREDIAAFMRDAAERGVDLRKQRRHLYSVQYGDTSDYSYEESTAIGVCHLSTIGNWVVINPTMSNSSRQDLRTLLYHELGHCLLYQDHIDGTDVDIMNPRISRIRDTDHWVELVDKLFNRGANE